MQRRSPVEYKCGDEVTVVQQTFLVHDEGLFGAKGYFVKYLPDNLCLVSFGNKMEKLNVDDIYFTDHGKAKEGKGTSPGF